MTWSLIPGPEIPWLAQEESPSAIQLSHQPSSPDQLARRPENSAFSQTQNSPLGQSAALAVPAVVRAPVKRSNTRRDGVEQPAFRHAGAGPFREGTGRPASSRAARRSARSRDWSYGRCPRNNLRHADFLGDLAAPAARLVPWTLAVTVASAYGGFRCAARTSASRAGSNRARTSSGPLSRTQRVSSSGQAARRASAARTGGSLEAGLWFGAQVVDGDLGTEPARLVAVEVAMRRSRSSTAHPSEPERFRALHCGGEDGVTLLARSLQPWRTAASMWARWASRISSNAA